MVAALGWATVDEEQSNTDEQTYGECVGEAQSKYITF